MLHIAYTVPMRNSHGINTQCNHGCVPLTRSVKRGIEFQGSSSASLTGQLMIWALGMKSKKESIKKKSKRQSQTVISNYGMGIGKLTRKLRKSFSSQPIFTSIEFLFGWDCTNIDLVIMCSNSTLYLSELNNVWKIKAPHWDGNSSNARILLSVAPSHTIHYLQLLVQRIP